MLVVVGWLALLTGIAAGAWWLLGAARDRDILAPVAAGLALRLGVMGVAHCISLLNGNGGFLFIDDQGYAVHGDTIATGWVSGSPESLLEPVGYAVHGGPLFYNLVGTVWFLTGGEAAQLGMKLVNVLLASTMVLSAWVLARAFTSAGTARLVAWFTALMPTLVWWSAPMMKEPLAGALFMGVLAAATQLPRPRATALVFSLLTLLAFTRITVALAAGVGIAAWLTVRVIRERAANVRLLVPAATFYAALALMLLLMGGGSSQAIGEQVTGEIERRRIEAKTRVEDGEAQSRRLRYESDPGIEDDSFDSPVGSDLADAPLTAAAASGVRFLITPRAWAFHTQPFDWHQPLYPAMWLWYVLLPIGGIGLWRLRTRPEVLLVAVPIAATLALYAVTLNSGVRQRTAVEPLLLVLIAIGIAAWGWPRTLRLGAAALVLAAVVASADLKSPLAAIPILAGAALVWGVSSRIPDRVS